MADDTVQVTFTAEDAALIEALGTLDAKIGSLHQDWDQALQPMSRGFDAFVSGVVTGHETISKAAAKAADDMVVGWVESIGKMTAQWLAFETATSLFGGGSKIATAIGDPFSGGGLGGALGGILGIGQNTAQAASETANTAAVTANTAALTTLTAATSTSATSGGAGLLSFFGLGAFAVGGAPPVGQPSLVGEQGPELFVPGEAGTIMPAGLTASLRGGSFNMPGAPALGNLADAQGGDVNATFGDTHFHATPNMSDAQFRNFVSRNMSHLVGELRNVARNAAGI